MKMTPKLVTAVWMAAALLVGCGDDDELDPAEAVAAVELAETQSGLMPGGLLPIALWEIEQGMTPEQAAQQAGDTVGVMFEPEGCASAEVDGAAVVYSLDGCLMRRGLGSILHPDHGRHQRHGMAGTFRLTFGATAEGFEVDIAGSDITGRKAAFDVVGKAQLSVDGSKRKLSVVSDGTGTTRCGGQVTRSGSHTRSYDTESGCIRLEGSWKLNGPNGEKERTVSGYGRCGDGCPEAGGQMTGEGMRQRHRNRNRNRGGGDHTGGGERPQARWSSSDGDSGTIQLQCTPDAD